MGVRLPGFDVFASLSSPGRGRMLCELLDGKGGGGGGEGGVFKLKKALPLRLRGVFFV